jgi:hypothetical protein
LAENANGLGGKCGEDYYGYIKDLGMPRGCHPIHPAGEKFLWKTQALLPAACIAPDIGGDREIRNEKTWIY